jgi:uncharacterized damage-inducible protein DinB
VKSRYQMFAGYNAWCNERLYDAAALVPDAEYRADRGAFFKSLHGTLNHILVADRIWMRRFTGVGDVSPLDTILFERLEDLRAEREAEDGRIIAFVEALDEAGLARMIEYSNSSGRRFSQPVDTALDHFFNHQAHHRGQAHALLSHFLGNAATPSLDLIGYQRLPGGVATVY